MYFNRTKLMLITLLILSSTIKSQVEYKLISGDYILSTNNDNFGTSVSIFGDYAIIGTPYNDEIDNNVGAAYVFHKSDTGWTKQQKLTPNEISVRNFGNSVAISGDYAVIGAHKDGSYFSDAGAAYIFHRVDTTWYQEAKLTADDAEAYDQFGYSVSISGNYVVIGSWQDDEGGSDAGSIYLFNRNDTTWNQIAKITANDAEAGDRFGRSVSIFDTVIVAGSIGDDDFGSSSGTAYIFRYNGTSWSQEAKLVADDASAEDIFGYSVSIFNNRVVVGARNGEDSGLSSGTAYIFRYNGTSWSQEAKLVADDAASSDYFGASVSIMDSIVIIGAYLDDDNGNSSGSAYIFQKNSSGWIQNDKLTTSDAAMDDFFGCSVSINSGYALVGAYGDDIYAGVNNGSAYVYDIVDDPPIVINAIPDITVFEDATNTVLNISTVFTDGDNDDTNISKNIEFNSNPSLVVATIIEDTLILDYQDDQNGNSTIIITGISNSLTVEDTFTVTVLPVNDSPLIITSEFDDATEDQPYSFFVEAIDADIIYGDSLVYSLSIYPLGMIIDAITGEINWIPYNNDVGDTTITVIVTDDSSAADSQTFSLSVINTNDSPSIINPLQDIVVNEDVGNTVIDLNGVFDDDDISVAGDSLILNVSNDNVTLFSASLEGHTLTLSCLADQNGTANIVVTATDDSSATVTDTFAVTVNPVNDVPIVSIPLADLEIDEDSGNTVIDLNDVFLDVDILTNGDSLRFVVGNDDTTLLSTALNGDALTLSTIQNQNGSSEIYVTVTDDSLATASDTFLVVVNSVNDVPIIANSLPDIEVNEDANESVINLDGVFTDVDIEINGDSLSISVTVDNLELLETTLNGLSLSLNYFLDQYGIADVIVTATDEGSAAVSDTFSVLVNPINDTPYLFQQLPDATIDEDDFGAIIIPQLENYFDDVDINDVLAFTENVLDSGLDSVVIGSPTGMNFTGWFSSGTNDVISLKRHQKVDYFQANKISNRIDKKKTTHILDDIVSNAKNSNSPLFRNTSSDTTSLIVYPTENFNGDVRIIIIATDDSSAQVSDTLLLTVVPINDAPVLSVIPDTSVIEDDTLQIFLSAFDVEGDTLIFSVASDANSLTTIVSNTNLILIPNTNWNGVAGITISVFDGDTTVSDSFELTVLAVNDAPVLVSPFDDLVVDEDTEDTIINLFDIFTDVDISTNGDSLSISVTVDNLELLETTLNGLSLSLNYFPDQYGIADVIVTATDEGSAAVSDTFSVLVNPINDTPYLFQQIPDATIDEDDFGAVIIPSLEEYFGDIDEGDFLVFTGDTLGSGLDSLLIGSLNLNGLTSVSNYGGREIITLKRSHIKGIKTTIINAGHAMKIHKNFMRDKSKVSFSLVRSSVTSNGANSATRNSGSRVDSTALVVYPTENFVGDIQIAILATDTSNASVSDTLILTIENLNDAPFVLNAINDVEVDEDSEPVTLDISSVFDDVDILNGDSLTITAQSLIETLVAVDYDSISMLMLIFAENGEGETEIIVTATDLGGLAVNDTVHVNILPINDPPSVVTLISPDSSIVTSLLPEFHWSAAIDPDLGDSIHYELHWVKDGDDFVDSVLTDTNYAVPYAPLDDNSKFFWWVISMDRQYDSNHSEETVFWIDVTPEPPLAFNTVSPPDSAEGLSTEVSFVWNMTEDPDPLDNVTYTLVYATDYADSNTFEDVQTNGDTTASTTLTNDTEYFWWVMANDEDDLFTLSNNGAVNRIVVGTLSIVDELLPDVFALHQNYPNPFNPVTTLRYDLPENSFVNITIYDLLGRKVTTLVTETQDAGFKSVIWNATNDYGKPVSAGVYLYKIQALLHASGGQAGKFVQTKKMVLLK